MKTNTTQTLQHKMLSSGLTGLVTTVALVLTASFSFSQDKILFYDGSEYQVKVIEISDTEIKYRLYNEVDGPLRLVNKSSVFMINLENGTKFVYSEKIDEPTKKDTSFKRPATQKFGGPRFGITYITPGSQTKWLSDRGKNPMLTQFGWQIETRLFHIEHGPTGVVEFVPLVAGLEQGLFLPSGSLLIGLRGGGKRSAEFALGPNLSVSGFGMVFAVGANFTSGNVNFPVNIAYVPSVGKRVYNSYKQNYEIEQSGHRITLTIGFNMRKR